MAPRQRGSDGRRRCSAEFKREQLAQIERGEITFAKLSRKIDVDQSVVRRWKQLIERGSTTLQYRSEVLTHAQRPTQSVSRTGAHSTAMFQ